MNDSTLPAVRLRPAVAADSDRLLEWRNDPVSRAMSLSSEFISREQHEGWYAASLASDRRVILIGEDRATGEPIGMCRFDLEADGTAEVSINVAPRRRGGGIGSALLTAGLEEFARSHPAVREVGALIRVENPASIRLFEKAGFSRAGAEDGVARFRRANSV